MAQEDLYLAALNTLRLKTFTSNGYPLKTSEDVFGIYNMRWFYYNIYMHVEVTTLVQCGVAEYAA